MIRNTSLYEAHRPPPPKAPSSDSIPLDVKGWGTLSSSQALLCRRVPCKARNVPCGDHHNDNAYILIPPDVQHGTILKCSHVVCAASGRRFQYCSFCKTPVAQRNFVKRHSHSVGVVESQSNADQGGRLLPSPTDELVLDKQAMETYHDDQVICSPQDKSTGVAGATSMSNEEQEEITTHTVPSSSVSSSQEEITTSKTSRKLSTTKLGSTRPNSMISESSSSSCLTTTPSKNQDSAITPAKRMRISVTKMEYECLLHLRNRPTDATKREDWLDHIWNMTAASTSTSTSKPASTSTLTAMNNNNNQTNIVSSNDDDDDRTVLSEISHSSLVAPHEFESDLEELFD